MTSHDVVAAVRRRFGFRRVGHGGTLDPSAEGVLVLGLGRAATRRLGECMAAAKEYRAVMTLGTTTDTQDAEGKVTGRREWASVTEGRLREVLAGFRGELRQVPPMYSALKRGGVPLYVLARRGREVPREPRAVRIDEIELIRFRPPDAEIRVVCSKGTYIRTLCADIGEALGCGGHLKRLVRTRVGRFRLDGAVALDALLDRTPGELESLLRAADGGAGRADS
ncbi:MAG: tRNA pseudouridine(55) synthase TruB [bacterium]|nr:tRNA pseudouridine(55) synthase TruB [bacterium]